MHPPPTPPPHHTQGRQVSRIRAGIQAFAALFVPVVLLVGYPVVLATTIGNPFPGLNDLIAGDLSDRAVISVLVSVTWLALGVAWLQFTTAVLVDIFCRLARIPLPHRIVGVLPGQQHLARGLVAAVLV